MRAIILAGGKGTRLLPYTTVLPKPLMPIDDRPIMELVLRLLKKNTITDVTITLGYLSHLIKSFFGDGKDFGMNITYSLENTPLGTAGPIALVKDKLDSDFVVMNGDVLTNINLTEMIEFHRKKGAIMTLAVHRRTVKIDYGVLDISEDNALQKYTEKPTLGYEVSMGINVFSPEALDFLVPGERCDIPDLAMRIHSKNPKKVVCYRTDSYWLDIGREDDYKKAIEEFDTIKNVFE